MRSKLGIVPFVAVVVVWLVFVVLLVTSPLTLAEVWLWIGNLPIAARGLVTLVFLPWVLGLAVWFAQLDDGIRIAGVAALAVVSLAAFWPRRGGESAAGDLLTRDETATEGERADASLAGPGAVPAPTDHPTAHGHAPDTHLADGPVTDDRATPDLGADDRATPGLGAPADPAAPADPGGPVDPEGELDPGAPADPGAPLDPDRARRDPGTTGTGL